MLLAVHERITSWMAVPVKVTVCVLPAILLLLSVNTRLAVRKVVLYAPEAVKAVGVKVTAIVQVALAASVLPQLFVWVKSSAFVPPMLMLVRVRLVVPVLVRVTSVAELEVATP